MQNRTPKQIVDVPVPPVLEAIVEVDAPQESVQKRTPEQLVDEPVPQIAEEIVEGLVPWERIPVPSQRELHEACEQYAFEDDEEEDEEEEDEEEEEISRFPPHFRPRLWCRFLLTGSTCPHG